MAIEITECKINQRVITPYGKGFIISICAHGFYNFKYENTIEVFLDKPYRINTVSDESRVYHFSPSNLNFEVILTRQEIRDKEHKEIEAKIKKKQKQEQELLKEKEEVSDEPTDTELIPLPIKRKKQTKDKLKPDLNQDSLF